MAAASPIVASSALRTTFTISNLHCDSCVSQIERALYNLQPRPFSVAHAILSHSVTVSHPSTLAVEEIAKTLDEAGFDVYDDDKAVYGISAAFEQAVQMWRSGSQDVDACKRKRHMENCEECRERFESSSSSKKPRMSGEVHPAGAAMLEKEQSVSSTPRSIDVVSTEPTSTLLFEAQLTIEGMICASCTGSITGALEAEPWIKKVNVNLLTHSATVVFEDESRRNNIVSVIEEVGFVASIQQVTHLKTARESRQPIEKHRYQARYAIFGMTCSSCMHSITKHLEDQPWVVKIDVNLLTNSAHVILDDKSRAESIPGVIEEMGFDARLESVEIQKAVRHDQRQRHLLVEVRGFYCPHCPQKVIEAIRPLNGVTITKSPSIRDPVVGVSYTPDPPALSARSILKTIAQRDLAFEPLVHKSLSLEKRSQQLYRKERLHILSRLILCILCAVPTFIIGIVYMVLLPASNSGRRYLMGPQAGVERGNWAMFALSIPVYFFSADVFHKKMLKELRSLWRSKSSVPLLRRFYRFGSMNMLISLGTTIAFFASVAQLIVSANDTSHMDTGQGNETFFDSVVFLTLFLLVGRLIEAYSKARTGDAVSALGQLRSSEALLVGPQTTSVAVDLLEIGDIVRILPGTAPPTDGTIVAGQSRFDESSLTGESKLTLKRNGELVFSGTVNKDAAVNIRVTTPVGQSMLDEIIEAIQEGQTKRAPIERTADLLTGYFVPIVTLLAITTWIMWLILGVTGALPRHYLDKNKGGWPYWALEFAIAVFVVACPCGLGLAAPTALFVGSGIAAHHGILVKGGGKAFQEAGEIDIVAFDKTGTLTTGGAPKVTGVIFDAEDREHTLALAAKVEQDSTHPIAIALVEHCRSDSSEGLGTRWTEEVPGKGMRGVFDIPHPSPKSIEILAGNEALMMDHVLLLSKSQEARLKTWKETGNSIALIATREVASPSSSLEQPFTLAASFAIADSIRPESPHVISALHQRGIATWMLTGDNELTAQAVAAKVGISPSNVIAGVLPTQKSEKIQYLQRSQPAPASLLSRFLHQGPTTSKRAKVAMVGDGINDAPALATADVGIALASGTDIAVQTAPFVILNPSSSSALNLVTVLTLFSLARKVFRRVRFNFCWALLYNLVLVPVAAGVLYPIRNSSGEHVRLDPAWAALAMALSSVSVVLSSLSLRWSWLPGVGFRGEKRIG